MGRKSGFHFQLRDGYSLLAHITSKRYEAIQNLCFFCTLFNWISRLKDIISPQLKTDPYVITWCITGTHLSKKCDASFLPKFLGMRITMIWMLFLNFEVFHPAGVVFDLKFSFWPPSFHNSQEVNRFRLALQPFWSHPDLRFFEMINLIKHNSLKTNYMFFLEVENSYAFMINSSTHSFNHI